MEIGLRYDRLWQRVYVREEFLPRVEVHLRSAMASYSFDLESILGDKSSLRP